LDFDADGDLGLPPVASPRVITPRGLDKQSAAMRVISKLGIKIPIGELAISALLAVGAANSEERKERFGTKLAEFLD